MDLELTGTVVEWRGPAPYHFVPADDAACDQIDAVAPAVTYGWGVIPVRGRVGATEFTTSLFPREGGYWVPLKAAVRRAEGIELDDVVTVHLHLDV